MNERASVPETPAFPWRQLRDEAIAAELRDTLAACQPEELARWFS